MDVFHGLFVPFEVFMLCVAYTRVRSPPISWTRFNSRTCFRTRRIFRFETSPSFARTEKSVITASWVWFMFCWLGEGHSTAETPNAFGFCHFAGSTGRTRCLGLRGPFTPRNCSTRRAALLGSFTALAQAPQTRALSCRLCIRWWDLDADLS